MEMSIAPEILPKKVYLSGMGLLYRGYNGMYELKEQEPDNLYYERMEHHQYYGILIKNTRLVRDNGGLWCLLHTDGWSGYKDVNEQKIFGPYSPDGGPVGEWSNGVVVTEDQNITTWMRSNQGFAVPLLIIGLVMFSYLNPMVI